MVITPCTWNMTAAQLVTPTSSQLAAVNAIQAAVTASVNWSVNATGTSTAGYKWIEIKPSNANSVYKDYRILICERVNYSTGRNLLSGTSVSRTFNSTNDIYILFAPDGGAPGVTFTPGNIETAASVYVGSKYFQASPVAWPWNALTGTWTAIWLYECDGAIWIINRLSATSHQLIALGNIATPAKLSQKDFNSSGVEIGVPCALNKFGLSAGANSTMTELFTSPQSHFYYFYDTNGTKTSNTSLINDSSARGPSDRPVTANSTISSAAFLESGAAIFLPLNFYSAGSASSSNSPMLMRGVYWSANMKTRTTIQTGSPATTIGYTFYADDALAASSKPLIAFMNTP